MCRGSNRAVEQEEHHTGQGTRLRFKLLLSLLLLLVLLFLFPQLNQGTPDQRTDEKNCGLNDDGCHKSHRDDTLSIVAKQGTNCSVSAVILRDGEQLQAENHTYMTKAIAREQDDEYIHYLLNSDQAENFSLTSADPGPEDGEMFWLGFGYRDTSDEIHVFMEEDAYQYLGVNCPYQPVARVSLDPDFPEDQSRTITLDRPLDNKTLHATLPPGGGRLEVYFSGNDSYTRDCTPFSYFWDLNGDGKCDNGSTGSGLNETGPYHEMVYTEPGIYHLGFSIGEENCSDCLHFTLIVNASKRNPDLYLGEIELENLDDPGLNTTQGDDLLFAVYLLNRVTQGSGADVSGNITVSLYCSLGKENFSSWYLLDNSSIVGGLEDDSGVWRHIIWNTTEAVPDFYRFRLMVDPENDVLEGSEGNNEYIIPGEREITAKPEEPPGPPSVHFEGDIILTPEGGTVAVGGTTVIDARLLNSGESEAQVVVIFEDGKSWREESGVITIKPGGFILLSGVGEGFSWSPENLGQYLLSLELVYSIPEVEPGDELVLSLDVRHRFVQDKLDDPTFSRESDSGENEPWYQREGLYSKAILFYLCLFLLLGIYVLTLYPRPPPQAGPVSGEPEPVEGSGTREEGRNGISSEEKSPPPKDED